MTSEELIPKGAPYDQQCVVCGEPIGSHLSANRNAVEHCIALRIRAEREACAKVAEELCRRPTPEELARLPNTNHWWCHSNVAAAIRARGL